MAINLFNGYDFFGNDLWYPIIEIQDLNWSVFIAICVT